MMLMTDGSHVTFVLSCLRMDKTSCKARWTMSLEFRATADDAHG